MEYYNLYKLGRYGWIHVTAHQFPSLKEAITYYKKEWNITIGNNIGNFKVTGL